MNISPESEMSKEGLAIYPSLVSKISDLEFLFPTAILFPLFSAVFFMVPPDFHLKIA